MDRHLEREQTVARYLERSCVLYDFLAGSGLEMGQSCGARESDSGGKAFCLRFTCAVVVITCDSDGDVGSTNAVTLSIDAQGENGRGSIRGHLTRSGCPGRVRQHNQEVPPTL